MIAPTAFSQHYATIVSQLAGTLHKAELEYAAALIIRWHRQRGCENWISFSRADLLTLFTPNTDSELLSYVRNPCWQPDPMGLVEQGYVEGWDYGPENAAVLGRFTAKFFDAVEREWNKRQSRESA